MYSEPKVSSKSTISEDERPSLLNFLVHNTSSNSAGVQESNTWQERLSLRTTDLSKSSLFLINCPLALESRH